MRKLLLLFLVLPIFASTQVVDEVIQIDTITENIKVVYKLENSSSYYFNKIAVFAANTSQIAIEKSYTNYGQNGLYKVYHPTGRLKIKTVFANNKIHGEWTYYGLDGIIITKGVFREGIKHGYWAYKSLKIYGRYKKGLKHKRWKRIDENEDIHISHYKKGVLTSGKGIGNEITTYLSKPKKTIPKGTNRVLKSDTNVESDSTKIRKEYEQTIDFLTNNVLFRKALKRHFGTSMIRSLSIRNLYDQDRFKYSISEDITALDISKFIKESEEGKIIVTKIDSILKVEQTNLKQTFSGAKIKEDNRLSNNSTDEASPIEVVFSEIEHNLLRLDVNWTFKEEKSRFRVLLYFNENGKLKGAEYEKP